MARNGLNSFSIHAADADQAGDVAALQQETAMRGFDADGQGAAAVDPETAARIHLDNAIEGQTVALAKLEVAGMTPEFRLLGTETLELTNSKTVKFRQVYNKVPVYGSLVTVELDEHNDLLAINSAMGQPEGVSAVAAVSPAAALEGIEREGGEPDANSVGRLVFYYDDAPKAEKWRLCYLFEDVPVGRDYKEDRKPTRDVDALGLDTPLYDYVIDAHSGETVARLPRAADIEIEADDELGVKRRVRVSSGESNAQILFDPTVNVKTFDHDYRDFQLKAGQLKEKFCGDPPGWSRAGISAHANSVAVMEFLRDVLKRRGLDNRGGELVGSVNCTYWRHPAGPREWRNAAWIGNQMVYGQRARSSATPDDLVSLSIDLDVVAHEVVHGLTQRTSNLQYRLETGALNESYSDVFGVLVANFGKADRNKWDYRLGPNFRGDGRPLRNIADPTAGGYPGHMSDYRVKSEDDDHGGVHTNSSIHNKGAHLMMIAKGGEGSVLFSASELAALFYLALTQHLSRTSRFADSRRGVELGALTLFRNRPRPEIDERVNAIRVAFDAVGIT